MALSFEIQITGFPPPADAFTASHSSCGVPLTCTHANSLFLPIINPSPLPSSCSSHPFAPASAGTNTSLRGTREAGQKLLKITRGCVFSPQMTSLWRTAPAEPHPEATKVFL